METSVVHTVIVYAACYKEYPISIIKEGNSAHQKVHNLESTVKSKQMLHDFKCRGMDLYIIRDVQSLRLVNSNVFVNSSCLFSKNPQLNEILCLTLSPF